jgi:DNA polymerase-3 subunit beta
MHIRINQETLKTVIAKAITTTTAKLAVKSLNCFLLEAVDNKLTIKSTTLEVSSVITIPCEVIKKGVALLPAKALHDAVSACEKGDIVIKMNEAKQLSLTTSTSKIKLFTLPDVSDFPEFQTQGVDYVEIEPSLFVDTLQRTIGFSSSDETRYNLCGIHCNIDGGVVKFSATDGHRMSIIRRRFQSDLKMLNGVTIPRKLAQEIIAFIGEEKDEALQEIVKIGRKENKLFISIGSSLLFGNLLDETAIFPDVNQVTPKQSNIKHSFFQ